MKSSVVFFFLVGSAAALVHLLVVYALVSACAWQAQWANPIGFLTAFGVSFIGHSRWTFPIKPDAHARAVKRFFLLATLGFLMNQAAYAWGLRWVGSAAYLPLLVAVMLLVAVATFFLGKLWAFADIQKTPHARPDH